jgi:hypothetical protein
MKGLRRLSYDDRVLVVAKRLILDLPPWLNPPTSPHSQMTLMAAIGLELIEKEPEFGWGGGRHVGSVNKELAETSNPKTLYKRRKRELERLRAGLKGVQEEMSQLKEDNERMRRWLEGQEGCE